MPRDQVGNGPTAIAFTSNFPTTGIPSPQPFEAFLTSPQTFVKIISSPQLFLKNFPHFAVTTAVPEKFPLLALTSLVPKNNFTSIVTEEISSPLPHLSRSSKDFLASHSHQFLLLTSPSTKFFLRTSPILSHVQGSSQPSCATHVVLYFSFPCTDCSYCSSVNVVLCVSFSARLVSDWSWAAHSVMLATIDDPSCIMVYSCSRSELFLLCTHTG